MKVLHLIDTVKSNAIPWFYNLINHLPETENTLSSWVNNGTHQEAYRLIKYPYAEKKGPSFISKLYNKALRLYRDKNYVHYVKKNIGEVDLIHAHFAHVGWNDLKLKKLLNVPYIVSFYGYDYESIPYKFPIWKKRYTELFQKADLIIAEGQFGANKLIEMGCPVNKVRVCHLGVDVDLIPVTSRNKQQDELSLIQIAAIREKKGQVYSIKAFIKLLPICPNMHLTIVGEDQDNQLDYFKSLIPLEYEDKITFVDRIDFSTLYSYLNSFQVFIHPSCYSAERDCEGGAPIVLLDAQATGMPVIATTHCDIPDEVIHEETGLLTAEKDVEALSDSIRAFYKMDQSKYDTYVTKCRKHIEKHYDVKYCGKNMRSVYDSLV
jgi:colanic acid/amylovoran biosynthesis glycosyltransferase